MPKKAHGNKIQRRFNLKDFDKRVKPSPKKLREMRKLGGQLLLETVKTEISQQRSPVTGNSFRDLTSQYAKRKALSGAQPVPDLRLTGNMLEDLAVEHKRGNEFVLKIEGSQAKKAEGNNIGTYGGSTRNKPRPFIPDKREKFSADVRARMRRFLKQAK